MRIKICGITKLTQAQAIAAMGATAMGFICYEKSPRYIDELSLETIISNLPTAVDKIGVFVNENPAKIQKIVQKTNLSGVQLHGNESMEYCQQIKELLPEIELIKALRIKNVESVNNLKTYYHCVNTLLLDAYHPQLLGGTGHQLDWQLLDNFTPPLPWLLAGGLTPENLEIALKQLNPDGIDLSSGVEISPGHKDLKKVEKLFQVINKIYSNLKQVITD